MTYKYAAYLASGEILECPVFKTVFTAARFRVRNYATAAIICNQETKKPVAAIAQLFGKTFIWKGDMLHQNIINLLYEIYHQADEYGKFCWDMAGLG